MRKVIIGVMGPGEGATATDCAIAFTLGSLIAQAGWVLLTGGRNVGVMEAAGQGAKVAGGLTIGILPMADTLGVSETVDLAIVTGLGHARNTINVLSADVVIACGMGAGTASEIALALKANRPVILVNGSDRAQAFFQELGQRQLTIAADAETAIQIAREQIDASLSTSC